VGHEAPLNASPLPSGPSASGPLAVDAGPWAPLRLRLFRNLWLASVVSNVGTVMHTVGASWAATELTSSPALIGLVQTAWAVPGFLVALPAGALADVVDRRRLIVVTQLVSMALAGLLGVLHGTDSLSMPLLLAFTFSLSVVLTIAAPVFMAITPELVPESELGKAIGLNVISTNIAQSLGPAFAGVIIAIAGAGAVFAVNAASFLGIVIVARQYRPELGDDRPTEPVWRAVRTGLQYVRRTPRLPVLASRIALSMLFASALIALMPVLARGSLDVTASQFGLLSAALGVGAVTAAWQLPRANRRLAPDAVVMLASVCWAAGAMVFAHTASLAVALVAMALGGAGSMATLNVVFTTYTQLLPGWVRGRASSMVMLMVWLGTSVGATVWGAIASATSAATALSVAAIGHVVVTLVASVVLRIAPRGS
jgi:MFS family permease